MESGNKKETLAKKIKELKVSSRSKKTEILNDSEIKESIALKLREGVSLKAIHEVLKNSGYDMSIVTLRKWKEKELGKSKRNK